LSATSWSLTGTPMNLMPRIIVAASNVGSITAG
jgi:hypothetical protein